MEAISQIPQLLCGCGRQFSRGISGVSWLGGQCGWMAWDEDYLAQGFRHSSEEREAGEAWASFKTLATEDAGIPNRLAVSRRPTPWAFNPVCVGPPPWPSMPRDISQPPLAEIFVLR